MEINIRKGTAADVVAAHTLIKELALYEKAPEKVTNTPEQMLIDGFGDHPIYEFFVAEADGQIVGMSLYYVRYSTWRGRCIYLEDLIITEAWRGKGVGKLLLDQTARETLAQNAYLLIWQVLDWNEPAIRFYKNLNANFDDEWITCKMDKEELEKMLENS